MADRPRCPNCGDELPANAPQGLCPACLLKQGMESEATDPLSSVQPIRQDFPLPNIGGGMMPTVITRDVLESHLNCKYKSYLKLAAQRGSESDYEEFLNTSRLDVRQKVISKILALNPEGEVPRSISLTAAALKLAPCSCSTPLSRTINCRSSLTG